MQSLDLGEGKKKEKTGYPISSVCRKKTTTRKIDRKEKSKLHGGDPSEGEL